VVVHTFCEFKTTTAVRQGIIFCNFIDSMAAVAKDESQKDVEITGNKLLKVLVKGQCVRGHMDVSRIIAMLKGANSICSCI